MADEKRVIEISIEAEISDVTKSFGDLATQAERTADKLEQSGRRVDATMTRQSKSVGLLGRGMAAYSNTITNLGKTSKELDAHADKVNRISTGLLTVGAVGVAAVGAAVVKMSQFESSMSKVASTGDEAKLSLAGLRETAISAGKATQYSATEAADGITNMLKAGVSAKAVMEGGLTGALNLAAAGEMGVAEAAEYMATSLSQFELPGNQAAHVADLLAAGAGKAQGSVTDLAQALKYIGPVSAGMGISIEETVGALASLANQGIIGEQAGTGLRGVLMSLTSPSRAAKKEMAALGVELYDANGKFLGLSNMAGQLQKAYEGTTDAAKDMSLGIIFGNAQVTIARVLFSQGAEGVQEWINKVNDAGYAARAAATLMDNLGGDVEKLGGSLETVAIQSGSGLNTMLRNTVQGASSAVDAIGNIPAPVLEAGTRMAALAGVGLLVSGGLLRAATGAAQAHQSMALLRAESPRLAAGLDKSAKAAKAAGIALAALQVISIFGSSAQQNIDARNGSLGDMAEALAGVATAGKGLGQLDSQIGKVQERFFFWETGAAQAENMGDAIKQVADSSKGFGAVYTGLSQTIAGLFGTKIAVTELQEQVNKLDQALTTMDPTQAQVAFKQITDSAIAQGTSMDDLLNQFPQYKATLQSTATALGVTDLAAKDYVEWMGGKVPTAVAIASAAHPDLVGKLSDTQKAAAGGVQALDDYVKSLYAAADAELALSGSQVSFEAGIDKARGDSKALVKKAKSTGQFTNLTNIDTKLGREAKTILDQLATSANTYTKALIQNGGSQEEVRLAVARARAEFVGEATDMGFSKAAANDLADARGLIPENINLETTDEGTQEAAFRTQVLADSIMNLPPKAKVKVESAFERGGVSAAYAALAKIDGKAADAFIKSILKNGGIKNWESYRPSDKHPRITPSLTRSTFNVTLRVSGRMTAVADGAVLTSTPEGLVKSFGDGGFSSTIGAQQPQIQTNHGLAGIRWAEEGSGPWEAFISGHPAKRERSRELATEVVDRLGGYAVFADGGFLDKGVPYGQRAASMATPSYVTNINVVNHHPQAEPTSVTVNRAQQLAAAIGR